MEENFENNRRGRRPNYNNFNKIQRNYSSDMANDFNYEDTEDDLINNSEPVELTPFNIDDAENDPIDLTDFHKLEFDVLKQKVEEYGVETAGLDRDGLKKAMLDHAKIHSIPLRDTGVMERVEDKKNPGQYWGYLRHGNFSQSPYDIYISHSQMVRFGLRDGDIVTGLVRSPKGSEKYHCLLKIESINFKDPLIHRERTPFEELKPTYPDEKINLELSQDDLETYGDEVDNTSLQIIDLFAPIGKGTRGLIVSPPKSGKTTLLKHIAKSIIINYPDIYLIVLLVDERPEEVTDFKESLYNVKNPDYVRVVSSTFDEESHNHIKVSNMVLNISKRMVESGHDVVVLLDSITRMARSSNLIVPFSGKLLSGGIDPASLNEPKKFIGAARNIKEGGSLTILATALIETNSKMDDAIFEEFKATGNMELCLDRSLAEKRVFPAIDLRKSGTRHDELLFGKDYKIISAFEKALYDANLPDESEKVIRKIREDGGYVNLIQQVTSQDFSSFEKEEDF